MQMLLKPKEHMTTFYAVYYRGKKGHEDIVEGVQASFLPTMDAAERAVAACKRWFNEETVVRQVENSTTVEKRVRDKVDVWIDTYKVLPGEDSPQLVHSGEPGWSEKSSDTGTRPNTSSTGKK